MQSFSLLLLLFYQFANGRIFAYYKWFCSACFVFKKKKKQTHIS